MPIWTEWWFWMSAALALATLEVLVPSFISLGFAIGAFVLGGLTLIGVTFTFPITMVVFAVASLIAYIGMRYFFALPKGQVKHWDRDINE
jgi:membrane protein implicated in regulation of membrane protease activity